MTPAQQEIVDVLAHNGGWMRSDAIRAALPRPMGPRCVRVQIHRMRAAGVRCVESDALGPRSRGYRVVAA